MATSKCRQMVSCLDLIEFSYEHISEPTIHDYHSFFSHSHYSYDQAKGRQKFEEEINRIFERNGLMAFQLEHGEVVRPGTSGCSRRCLLRPNSDRANRPWTTC